MDTAFLFAMAAFAFFGAFWLWIGEGAVTRFPEKRPWWYVNPFWWPRRYEKVLGRISAVAAVCAGLAFFSFGIFAIVS